MDTWNTPPVFNQLSITSNQTIMADKEAILKKEMNNDYPLIPMSEITDEARLLSVAWIEGYEYQGMDIPGKQKLASDIMNYHRRHSKEEKEYWKQRCEAAVAVIHVFPVVGHYIDTEDEKKEAVYKAWQALKQRIVEPEKPSNPTT